MKKILNSKAPPKINTFGWIKKLVLLVAVLSLVLVSNPTLAAGTDITFTADTTISLTGLGINLTILSGSTVATYTVTTTALNFTMSSGSAITVRSSDFATLNNSLNKSANCTSTYSFVSFNSSDGSSVSVSPSNTNACVNTGGSNPGAGSPASSSGSSYSPPSDTTPPTNTSVVIAGGVVETTSASVTLTLAAVDAAQMTVSESVLFAGASWESYATTKAFTLSSGAGVKTVYAKFKDAAGNISTAVSDTITLKMSTATPPVEDQPVYYPPAEDVVTPMYAVSELNLLGSLRVGATSGAGVKLLQKFLNERSFVVAKKGTGSVGKETTSLSVAAKNAFKKYQKSVGLKQSGLIDKPTLKYFAQAAGEDPALVYEVWASDFASKLKVNMKSGTPIKLLQKFLNEHGYVIATKGAGSPGKENTSLGSATQKALKVYQEANYLDPTGKLDKATVDHFKSL